MRGRIDATPAAVARWASRFAAELEVAVEAGTGLAVRVCDALVAAGAVPHLAERVQARALRGRRRGASTDRAVGIGPGEAERRAVFGAGVSGARRRRFQGLLAVWG
jgi:hypothetical protein